VRAKASATAPVIMVNQPSLASSEVGPFRISWTDGLPEQNHVDATGWLKSEGSSGLSVQLQASSRPRTVILYGGAGDLRPTLSISGGGVTVAETSLGRGSQPAHGLVVTVSLPPTTGPTRIQFGGRVDGPAPAVYLAAVTVQLRP
jgi:hypothetical protein